MNRPLGAPSGAATGRHRLSRLPSARTLLLATVLLASAVSAASAYLLDRSFGVDVISSHLSLPQDCWLNWGTNIGRHCFSDYSMVVDAGMRANPYEPYPLFLAWLDGEPLRMGGPAAAFIPHLVFGVPAKLLGVPLLGLLGYLLALAIALVSPAIWAARGAIGLERVVVFVALGAAAVPVWAVLDRGNSAGFMVPIALVFLVALRRQRWALVALMVVLAALIKPQFVVFAVALLAARQWRWGGLAIVGVIVTNVAAYLMWPGAFPGTIPQSIHNLFDYAGTSQGLQDLRNVSFARSLLLLPDFVMAAQTGGQVPPDYLAGPRGMIGYVLLIVVVIAVLVLGRRIPPVMAGIVLIIAATLFPAAVNYYYLVFALPIAAIIVRDPGAPPGVGIMDRLETSGGRRLIGICLGVAAALSIAQIAIPSPPIPAPIFGQLGETGVIGTTPIVFTSATLVPLLWLLACVVIIASYGKRPAHQEIDAPGSSDAVAPTDDAVDTTSATASASTSAAATSHPPGASS